jgi:DNA-binding NarL/FixJ family response regulator
MPRALIVEDEELVRELLASVLHREFEFDTVSEAGDGLAGQQAFEAMDYDFVVLDLMLPHLDGLSLARWILQRSPGTRILALSSECDDYTIREVNRSGILGFVHKQEMTLEVIFTAFNEVSAGHVYYSTAAQKKIEHLWQDPDAYYKILTEKELHLVRSVALGLSHDAIAAQLGVQASTVKRRERNVLQKLNVGDRSGLMRFALDRGIVKYKGGLDWTRLPDSAP